MNLYFQLHYSLDFRFTRHGWMLVNGEIENYYIQIRHKIENDFSQSFPHVIENNEKFHDQSWNKVLQ